jgi:hypothetical protein
VLSHPREPSRVGRRIVTSGVPICARVCLGVAAKVRPQRLPQLLEHRDRPAEALCKPCEGGLTV